MSRSWSPYVRLTTTNQTFCVTVGSIDHLTPTITSPANCLLDRPHHSQRERQCERNRSICSDAIAHGFCSVVVNPVHVTRVSAALHGTNVRTASIIGFPLGGNVTALKVNQTGIALEQDADESMSLSTSVLWPTAGTLMLKPSSRLRGRFRQENPQGHHRGVPSERGR